MQLCALREQPPDTQGKVLADPIGLGMLTLPGASLRVLANPACFGMPVLTVPRFWALGNSVLEKPPAQDTWTQGPRLSMHTVTCTRSKQNTGACQVLPKSLCKMIA